MNDAKNFISGLPEEDLDKLIFELGLYAQKVRNKEYSPHLWQIKDGYSLPKGETVDSIVSLAFEKVLEGTRKWNRDKQPEFKNFMRDVIDSLINHLFHCEEHRKTSLFAEDEEHHEIDWPKKAENAPTKIQWLARKTATPEDILLRDERKRLEDKALQLLIENSANDPILQKIVLAMLNGYDKSGEIAAVTGIDVEKVYIAMKRLGTKVKIVKKQMSEEPSTARVGS